MLRLMGSLADFIQPLGFLRAATEVAPNQGGSKAGAREMPAPAMSKELVKM
jgi:hypothetical protein